MRRHHRDFTCRHCGYEGKLCVARTCLRCQSSRKLDILIDDGTGRPHAELKPLADYMRAQMDPHAVRQWLQKPGNREILADLAAGRLAISHQALAARQDRKKASYVRDLLIASGVLPAADKQLTGYEGWLHRQISSLDGHPHQMLLREFGTWHQLPRMRATAAARPLRQTAGKYAQLGFTAAETFLTWIHGRGTRPADVTQADIDAFFAAHKVHQRQAVRSFLTWAIQAGHIPPADVPVPRYAKGPGMTQDQRISLIRDFVLSDARPAHLRIAACLLLLFAQPLARIVCLTASDVTRSDDGQVYLRFGTPPTPVPEPFATMIEEYAAAAGTGDACLFPGLNAGQHRSYASVSDALRKAGLPMRDARTSALRDLVAQAPAPVVADALGIHQTTANRQLTAAGGTWSRYAATRHKAAPAHAPARPREAK